MKIIDERNKKYTKPEEFEVGDFFYNEINDCHYWIVPSAGCCKYALICLEDKREIYERSDIEFLLRDPFHDDPRLIKIPSSQVTIKLSRT